MNNFREIECCYTCKYTKGGQLKDRKSSVFWNCELAEKEIGKPFMIIDSNFICDRWEKFEHISVLEEIAKERKP
jgi:hypothetical protein